MGFLVEEGKPIVWRGLMVSLQKHDQTSSMNNYHFMTSLITFRCLFIFNSQSMLNFLSYHLQCAEMSLSEDIKSLPKAPTIWLHSKFAPFLLVFSNIFKRLGKKERDRKNPPSPLQNKQKLQKDYIMNSQSQNILALFYLLYSLWKVDWKLLLSGRSCGLYRRMGDSVFRKLLDKLGELVHMYCQVLVNFKI